MEDKRQEIDLNLLEKRFKERASFDVSEDKVNDNWNHFLKMVKKEGLSDG